MATWEYKTCKRDGTDLAEIGLATARTLAIPLNGIPTASFRIRLDDLDADPTIALDGRLLKVYRNNTLRFCGPVLTANETSSEDGGHVDVNAVGAFWRLGKRLIGKSWDSNGRGVGFAVGTPLAQVDRVQILVGIINAVNGEADTGIRLGTVVNTGINAYGGPWHFKTAAEAFLEIQAVLDGPDFEIVPVEPKVDGSGVQIGTMNIKPAIVTDRSQPAIGRVVFEYGLGKRNVKSYTRARTLDGLANHTWAIPQGYPDSHPAGQVPFAAPSWGPPYGDTTSVGLHGLAQALVSDDLVTDSFRQSLCDEHLRVRKQAREVITFEVITNPTPQYGDFLVGDLITCRAVEADKARFDASFRVYGASFGIDDEGNENMSLTLVPE